MTASSTPAASSNKDGESSPRPVSVLFVCLGNICRSTISEGVFQSLCSPDSRTLSAKPIHPLISLIDSCGTGAYHVGDGPDPRTLATLKKHNITSYKHRARKFNPARDFHDFDYILAMDDENLYDLEEVRAKAVAKLHRGDDGGKELGKVMLYGDFGGKKRRSGKGEVVVDPYYGADDGFEVAYEQARRFGKAFLEELEKGRLS